MKRLQIFRAGKQTARSGESVEISPDLLRAAAAAYDPKVHEAPIRVGHSTSSSPAYGWISSLSFSEDGSLEADPIQVDPAFAELVQAGRYKKVSATFYKPDAPTNPKPGVFYLRDVAFLGAEPPAVKGLRAVEFSEADTAVLEFSDWNEMSIARLFRGLRDLLIARFGKDDVDKALPDYAIDDVLITASRKHEPESPAALAAYQESTQMKPEEIQAAQAKLATERADLEGRERAVKEREAKQRHDGHVEFAEAMVTDGKLLPVHKAVVVALLDSMPEGAVVEFSEGDKTTKESPVALLQGFIGGLPKLVEFGEHAAAGAGNNQALDPNDSQAIASAALEFQESERKAGRTVSTSAAVTHVMKKGASA